MSSFIQVANSKWTKEDILRSLLGYGFTTVENDIVSATNLNLQIVQVEDSGEQYFCDGGKKFEGWDILLRELCEVPDGSDHISLRVCVGITGGPLTTCDLDARKLYGTPIEALLLRLIGKGVDGKPVVRLGQVDA